MAILFYLCSFSLLSSEDEKNRFNGVNPSIDKRTNGYKLRRESIKKTTEVMYELLDQLAPYGVPAKYLLLTAGMLIPA
jgi:hypothetical protein